MSDAVAAAGLGDGTFTLGGLPLVVSDGVARREDGMLAGSTQTLRALSGGSSRSTSRSRQPSRRRAPCRRQCCGSPASAGSPVGLPADVVVLDDALEVVRTVVAGVDVYRV